jgi:hypothetical protein
VLDAAAAVRRAEIARRANDGAIRTREGYVFLGDKETIK